jgi:hypothetical protein
VDGKLIPQKTIDAVLYKDEANADHYASDSSSEGVGRHFSCACAALPCQCSTIMTLLTCARHLSMSFSTLIAPDSDTTVIFPGTSAAADSAPLAKPPPPPPLATSPTRPPPAPAQSAFPSRGGPGNLQPGASMYGANGGEGYSMQQMMSVPDNLVAPPKRAMSVFGKGCVHMTKPAE